MKAERHIQGLLASSGFAMGQALVLGLVDNGSRLQLAPAGERQALAQAIGESIGDTATLMSSLEGAAVDMMGFQLALLEDDALTEAVWPKIEAGQSAQAAWKAVLNAEIDGYRASADEHFRARAADLEDIRERALARLFGARKRAPVTGGEIIVADDLAPSFFMETDWSKGGAIILGAGSPSSHVAMLARAQSVPMLVGIGDAWRDLSGRLIVDAEAGSVVANPANETVRSAKAKLALRVTPRSAADEKILEPAVTADGIEISILVNVASLNDLALFPVAACDGVGLTRTEFFIEDVVRDEDKQYARYTELVRWADGRPVTVRTIDAGGDKPIPGYTAESELNPFLGTRGVRLSLRHKDVFRIQLRALLRAATHGRVKIMLPMVTRPSDLEEARAELFKCEKELQTGGVKFGRCELGIMVEVPAVALCPELFAADFYSIGSNDLTQYATAAGRGNAAVADYADVSHPGVMAMIKRVTDYGHVSGKQVSLCGDAAGDPRSIDALLRAGVRAVSVSPAFVGATKAAIRAVNLAKCGANG